MSNHIIKVESLSKQYRLGQVGTGSLSHDINRIWHKARGKEDPYLQIGEEKQRDSKGTSDYIWALKDINFDIEQGNRVGIVGRNGAGKSTLLKILSRTTSPTSGAVKIKGKVASLLEVGTGFHPELSGRDNVFLNGAILGMSKRDIKNRLEEIIEFSGVERYIDTPVKRYSSGMYVRLAFAVAAHLESDILIVDEVLAVGDFEFQKKCIGKLDHVSNKEGRTVIFVSHNMEAVMRLCTHAIILENGTLKGYDFTNNIIDTYLRTDHNNKSQKRWSNNDAPGNDFVSLLEVKAQNSSGQILEIFDTTQPIDITIKYVIKKSGYTLTPAVNFYNSSGLNLFDSHQTNQEMINSSKEIGTCQSTLSIPGNIFSEGTIIIGVGIVTHNPFLVHIHETDIISFKMIDQSENNPTRGTYRGGMPGLLRPLLSWNTLKI